LFRFRSRTSSKAKVAFTPVRPFWASGALETKRTPRPKLDACSRILASSNRSPRLSTLGAVSAPPPAFWTACFAIPAAIANVSLLARLVCSIVPVPSAFTRMTVSLWKQAVEKAAATTTSVMTNLRIGAV
jgi:hypothetical protein